MARIPLDTGVTELDLDTPNSGNGDTLRDGGSKLKQWAADINAMTTELYVGAGGYKPGSILSPLNLFDRLRWHVWFEDFITGPVLHTPDSSVGWAYVPGFPQWISYGSRAGVLTIERNIAAAGGITGGSWVQLATGAQITDYLHLCAPDASGAIPGATSIPVNGSTKKYAVAMKVVFNSTTAIYRVGFGEVATDPNLELSAKTATGVYVQTNAGVATVYIRNYEYVSPKAAALPTTITYTAGTTYEFELLIDGAGSFTGQYRAYTAQTPGAWISLGSVSLSGWALEPGNTQNGPWIAVKNTVASPAELGVDYLLVASER